MRTVGVQKTQACFVFDLHRGLPLRPAPLRVRSRRDPLDLYFETEIGGEVRDLADRALLPAVETLANGLDQGFACALAVSGTLVDLLDRHAPDALAALARLARHPRVEVLATPYHHGLSALLPDTEEFLLDMERHRARMEAVFGVVPAVFAPPELCVTRAIAEALPRTGCTALLTEPRWCLPRDLDPTLVYRFGPSRVLLRHCRLSDDLAQRFFSPEWDRYPLSAGTYADWLARTPGECVLIGLDLDLFGDGGALLAFFDALPGALDDAGVVATTPSGVLAAHPAEWPGPDREVGWTVPDEGESWFETILQHSAASALQRAGAWLPDREVWRHLSSTDHFRAMAMRTGGCGQRQSMVGHQATVEAFGRFMRALSALEERMASRVRSRKAAVTLRTLPPELAFVFSRDGHPAGYAAHSLAECIEQLTFAADDVVAGHIDRQDFSRWCRDVLMDGVLAERVIQCRNRNELQETMQERIEELERRRRSPSSAGSPSTP
ncbi:MAG TPA: alpha-amylase [Methanoregulaceae archaeon]|nr:alpha-amylase [Methanoregulaceae archaeon]